LVFTAFMRVGTANVHRQGMRDRGGRRGFGSDLAAAAAGQALIGRDQGGVGIDPDPTVARVNLHIEVQMARGAVGMVEVVRDHADLFAFVDVAAIEDAVGIHGGRVHVHVAKTDVLVAGVDLQRRRLLFQGTDQDAIANGDNGLLPGIATAGAFAVLRRTRAGPDILSLMTETGGALTDFETPRLAKIVHPGIAARSLVGGAVAERLRADEGRRFFQRKPDLRIGGQVGVPALFARTAMGEDVTAWTI